MVGDSLIDRLFVRQADVGIPDSPAVAQNGGCPNGIERPEAIHQLPETLEAVTAVGRGDIFLIVRIVNESIRLIVIGATNPLRIGAVKFRTT